MDEWVQTTLNELINVQQGYAFKSKDFLESNGVPVVKIKNVASGKVDLTKVQYIAEVLPELEKYLLREKDILIAMTGSNVHQPASMVGKVSRYNCVKPALLNQRVGRISTADPYKLDEGFLYYFLIQEDVTYGLALNAGGSANQANISSASIKSLNLKLPQNVIEQKAIAGVLSSLDDKIDLLHRQNKTLEALAETLFRQWFIEEAQDDWEERPLDEVADYLNGLACQKFPATDPVERLPVLKIKGLRNGISDSSDWVTTDINPKYLVRNGDIIFSWSASLLVKIWDGDTCVLNQHLFKVTSDEFPKWFIYLWTTHHLARFIAIAETKSTTMGHIKRGDLSASMVAVPSPNEIERLDVHFNPIFQKIISNNQKIKTLEKLRDTLLPKLMNGEARVDYDREEA